MKKTKFLVAALLAGLGTAQIAFAGGEVATKFTNQGSIGNTRHNLTQRQLSGGGPLGTVMDSLRNDYGEICVYCHTPHGANTNIAVPLWNRTAKSVTYTPYSSSTLSGTVTTPGAGSLSCLSCHDGQTAIDSIVNMPGSGRYSATQLTNQDNTFLNTWVNPSGTNASHTTIGLAPGQGCRTCHDSQGTGTLFPSATDFTAFAIGTDLSNDHPVGVTLPSGSDWNVPGGTKGSTKFFDTDGDGLMGKKEIRFYDSGQGPEVECASCHDPHGVPTAGTGSAFTKTFLRVDNAGSAVCMTCHSK